MTVEEFLAIAASWLGVPYHKNGKSRLGVDCAGLAIALAEEAGVVPDGFRAPDRYSALPTGELEATLDRWCRRARRRIPGVILSIRWPDADHASHTAILTGPTIIHAYRKQVIEHGYRGYWVRRTSGAWYVPGVEYE